MKSDKINDHILQELQSDGRISNLDLADRVGLSPSACLRRVQELEIGKAFVAYVGVGLNDHSKSSQEAFEQAISKAPEVLECHNITGTIEYILRVECADLPSYKTFHTDMLGALPQVNAITSYVVMGSPKDERG